MVTDIGRTGVTISDPTYLASEAGDDPRPNHFIGPFTFNSSTNATVDYQMWVPVGTYINTAYGQIGAVLIGATSSAMSRITVTSDGTGSITVVSDTVNFSVDAVTGTASNVTSSGATLNGTVDPNGAPVSAMITLDEAGQCGQSTPSTTAATGGTSGSSPSTTGTTTSSADFSGASFDLYIVNPDGSVRHMSDATYARITQVSPTVERISFEDKGSDFDYNDVVVEVDYSDWSHLKVTVVSVSAGWKHNVRLTIFKAGQAVQDLLIWVDSHLGVGQTVVINADAGGAFESGESSSTSIVLPAVPVYLNPNSVLSPKTTETSPASTAGCDVACGDIGYDLYIVNPDGSERHLNTKYTELATMTDGRQQVRFEDKGVDFDYNDVTVVMDTRDCKAVTFELVGVNAAWHHQVLVAVSLKGALAFTRQLWADDHAVTNDVVTVDAKDEPAMCAVAVPVASPASAACSLAAPLRRILAPGSSGSDVVSLQDLLKCLGLFPAEVPSTGYYGTVTTAAMTAYQSAHAIAPPIGIVGPLTRASLNTLVTP